MSPVDNIDVRGTGNLNAELMVVGEAYGAREEIAGMPFVGTSGDELNRYLSSIRISRESVYVTNVVNERPPGNSDPTREMIERHSLRLGDELLTVRPQYVLALGRYALQWFCGPDTSITHEWGIPREVRLCVCHGLPWASDQHCRWVKDSGGNDLHKDATWTVVLVAAHHPAYGLYMPDDQVLIQEALEGRMQLTWGLRRVMDGELAPHPPVDQYPHPEYRELTDPADIELVLGAAKVVALDTEGSPRRPWCISVCVEPGRAYAIAATNAECVRAFADWLDKYDPLVVMHFATHDIEVLTAMGITVRRLGDSMLIAHLLGPHFSQALKLGAYRELGMHMRDYTDLTRDADRALAVVYLERVLSEGRCADCRGRGVRVWMEPAHTIPAYSKTVTTKKGPVVLKMKAKLVPARRQSGVCESCEGDGTNWPVPRALPVWDKGRLTPWQPSPVGKRIRRILDDVRAGKTNKDGEPTDPRARWEGADPPEAIAAVVERLGPMPTATLDMVPRHEAIEYAARDADATLRRWLLLDPKIDEWGLRETYNTDLAIIPLIVDMQRAGMQVDRQYFADLSVEWRAEMSRIRHRLQKLVGYYVNPASSKQVANLLFVRLGLPPVKQTRSKESESTDDKVLEQLLITTKSTNPVAHEAITLITRHREIHKLDGTYADPLSKVESRDGRVRMEFRYTRTPTGRLSSAKPRSGQNKRNFIQGQNIPTRTEEGKRIRKGIVARDGYLIGSWDLSQIEWRVMAHLSQDKNLIKAFREGLDLHRMTASLIYNVPISEVTSSMRTDAKCVHPDTLVWTPSGPTSIGSIGSLGKRDTFRSLDSLNHIETGDGRRVEVTHTYNGGRKKLLHIVAARGYLTCSPEHRIQKANGKLVRAGDLKVGDLLAEPQVPLLVDRPYVPIKAVLTEFAPPTYILPSHAHAYFAGLYTGDGHRITNKHVGFTHGSTAKTDKLGVRYEDWQEVLYQAAIAIGFPARKKKLIVSLGHIAAHRYLEALQLTSETGKTLRIPQWVLDAGRESVLHFLGGLFDTDGTVSAKTPYLSMTTKDAVFAGQVASVIASLGLRVSTQGSWNGPYQRYYYKIAIPVESSIALKPYMRHPGKVNRLRERRKGGGHTWRDNVVTHIIDAGVMPCMDVTVASKDHLYLANSFVTHNSVGFGMGYKISWRGLQQQFAVRGIELTKDEAQAFIDGFMAAYPGIPRYWESVFAEARRNGYVRHPDGRIRWATAIRCTASWVREAAERELGNSPVQGFAAWIMKRIMIAADRKVIKPLNKAGFDVKMLLVVHDSLESEFPDGVEAMFDPLMRRVMRETVKLSVPVMGDGKWGSTWAACKPD